MTSVVQEKGRIAKSLGAERERGQEEVSVIKALSLFLLTSFGNIGAWAILRKTD